MRIQISYRYFDVEFIPVNTIFHYLQPSLLSDELIEGRGGIDQTNF